MYKRRLRTSTGILLESACKSVIALDVAGGKKSLVKYQEKKYVKHVMVRAKLWRRRNSSGEFGKK
jgi:hypothetical protein